METFNDDDQAQQLKDWWKQNWQPVLLGLGLSIGGVLGWNSWQAHQQSQAEQASGYFEQLRLSLAAGNLEAATSARQSLAAEHTGSPYAAQAALMLAQHYVKAEDYASASAQLRWVVDNADDDKLADIASLRLARVQWAQGEDAVALTLLQEARQSAFTSLFSELRGDILLAQGKSEEARAAYQDALSQIAQDDLAVGVNRSALQSKLDDLAGPDAVIPASDS